MRGWSPALTISAVLVTVPMGMSQMTLRGADKPEMRSFRVRLSGLHPALHEQLRTWPARPLECKPSSLRRCPRVLEFVEANHWAGFGLCRNRCYRHEGCRWSAHPPVWHLAW